MSVKPIPEGFHTVTPYLTVDGAAEAIDFYKRAFGAVEQMRMPTPDGKIGHAHLQIGDSNLMLADSFERASSRSPKELGAISVGLFLYVEDVDAAIERAAGAGATVAMPPEDMFWGDRFGRVTDPFGHEWQIATHVEDVAPDEMAERGREAMAGMSSGG